MTGAPRFSYIVTQNGCGTIKGMILLACSSDSLSKTPAYNLEIVVVITRPWVQFHRRLLIESLAGLLAPTERIWVLDRPLEPLLSPWKHRQWLQSLWHPVQSESPQLQVFTPKLPVHDQLAYRYQPLENLNLSGLKKQLLPHLQPSSFKVLWLMHPCFFAYTRLLKWDFLVYDCYDEFVDKMEPIHRLVGLYERILFHAADYTIVASPVVAERKQAQYGTSRFHLLPNPTSYTLFSQARHQALTLPPELQRIPMPRVCYIGGLKPFLDQKLLVWLAQRLPQVSFVLIGSPEFGTDISSLQGKPNIHCLGHQPLQRLPSFLAGMHTGLIPYMLNDYTRTINPNKAMEYLMAGLEVVSIPIPSLLGKCPDSIHLAASQEDFLAALQDCLNRPPHQLPETVLWEYSWEYQLQPLLQHIHQTARLARP